MCWQWIAEEVISSSGEPQCVFMVWSFWLQHNTTPKTYRKHSCHWPSVCIHGIPCFFSGQTLWVTSWYRRASGDVCRSSAETGHRWKSYENCATFAHCQSSMFHAHKDIEGADVFVSRISHVFNRYFAPSETEKHETWDMRVSGAHAAFVQSAVGSQLTSMIQPPTIHTLKCMPYAFVWK